MHVLGISNGKLGGNSETLLKAALTAAQKANSTITTSWIHVPSVNIPKNASPLKGGPDISRGTNPSLKYDSNSANTSDDDDRLAVKDAILDADAIIIATPIYSHQPAGPLKLVVDSILGPFTDAIFAQYTLEKQKQGDPEFANIPVDMRLLKPRVVGFIAVGGSTTPDQSTMALPTLHILVYPLHAKVVDQVVLQGYGGPGSVLTAKSDGEDAIARARLLGQRIASQIGLPFDEAQYLGEEVEGACPYCHLRKIELSCTAGNAIICVTCGAQGSLDVRPDGIVGVVWDQKCIISSITRDGKLTHLHDVARSGREEKQRLDQDKQLEEKRAFWRSVTIPHVSLPSQSRKN